MAAVKGPNGWRPMSRRLLLFDIDGTILDMRHMVRQRSGRIVDVGSLVGANPNPGAAPYSVSKAALQKPC